MYSIVTNKHDGSVIAIGTAKTNATVLAGVATTVLEAREATPEEIENHVKHGKPILKFEAKKREPKAQA